MPRPANENESEKAIWLDHGADNYAGVTWSDNPDDRALFIGWMSNWQYAQVVPTESWRSAMTLPRVLGLHKEGSSYRVHSAVVEEFDQLLGDDLDPNALSESAYMDLAVTGDFKLLVSNEAGEFLELSLSNNTLAFDRTKAGISDFEPGFAAVHELDLSQLNTERVEVYLDASSVEIFINNGQRVMTELIFPSSPYSKLSLEGAIQLDQLKKVIPMSVTD